jgi:endogenous inhibitor of DNA gyrase (YacG/DUF329 family)
MRKDVTCPYCDEEVEINHDDGIGYEEDETHNQPCPNCGKYFVYTTSIHFYYEAEKADCLNGSEHTFEQTHTIPKTATRMRCTVCDEERQPTRSEWLTILSNDEIKELKTKHPNVDWIKDLW